MDSKSCEERVWLSLMIGNSRLHWALMEKDSVAESWDSGHLEEMEEESEVNHNVADGKVAKGVPLSFITASAQDRLLGEGATVRSPTEEVDATTACLLVDPIRICVASVVPKEMRLWLRRCPGIIPLSSGDAIKGLEEYPTLGVDRALALRGAARVRGWPAMVVDCGSALTFTACDENGRLAGGAILPGVRLQLRALGTRTAQLPSDVVLPDELPPRWAMNTPGAIQSGVMWTIVEGIQSFVKDRWKLDPTATIVFTGGDGRVLHKALLGSWRGEKPDVEQVRDRIYFIGDVIHRGIASVMLGES